MRLPHCSRGLAAIWALGAATEMYLPWTVLVVGAHFLGFVYVRIWPRRILVTALVMIALGIAGLAVAATADRDWTPLISGVLTGLTMLAGLVAALLRHA